MEADQHPPIRSAHAPRPFRVRGESYSDLTELAKWAMKQDEVLGILRDSTPYTEEALRAAVAEFFTSLGLPSLYYESTSDASCAKHIASLMAARELARSSGRPFDIQLQVEEDRSAFFAARSMIVTDRSGYTSRRDEGPAYMSPANVLERYLETKYLGGGENTIAGSVPLTQDHLASLPAFLEATKRTETATTDRAGAMQELATTIKSLGIGGAPTATSTESGAQQPGGSQLGQQQGQLSITGGQAQPQQIPPTAGQTPQPSSMGQPGPLAENAPAGDAAASASGTSGGAAPTPTTVPATGSRGARVGRGTWRLQCYRSKGVLEDGAHLRLYFLQAPDFVNPRPPKSEVRIEQLADKSFLERTSKELLDTYAKVLREASERMGPSIHIQKIKDVSEGEDSDVWPSMLPDDDDDEEEEEGGNSDTDDGDGDEGSDTSSSSGNCRGGVGGNDAAAARRLHRRRASGRSRRNALNPEYQVDGVLLLLGHRVGTTHSLFSSMPNVYRYLGMYCVTKYVEVFSNGVVIYAFRLRQLHPALIPMAAPSMPLTTSANVQSFSYGQQPGGAAPSFITERDSDATPIATRHAVHASIVSGQQLPLQGQYSTATSAGVRVGTFSGAEHHHRHDHHHHHTHESSSSNSSQRDQQQQQPQVRAAATAGAPQILMPRPKTILHPGVVMDQSLDPSLLGGASGGGSGGDGGMTQGSAYDRNQPPQLHQQAMQGPRKQSSSSTSSSGGVMPTDSSELPPSCDLIRPANHSGEEQSGRPPDSQRASYTDLSGFVGPTTASSPAAAPGSGGGQASSSTGNQTPQQQPQPQSQPQSQQGQIRHQDSIRQLSRAGHEEAEWALRAKRIARLTGPNAPSIDDRMKDLARDASLLFVLPRTSVTPLLNQGLLSAQECSYAYSVWKFTYHFLPRMAEETSSLIALIKAVPALSSDKATALTLVSRLRKALQASSFTESAILDVIFRHPDVASWLYDDFCRLHKPRTHSGGLAYTPNPVSAVILRHAKSSATAISLEGYASQLERSVGGGGDDATLHAQHGHNSTTTGGQPPQQQQQQPAHSHPKAAAAPTFDFSDPALLVRSRQRKTASEHGGGSHGSGVGITQGSGGDASSAWSQEQQQMQQPLPFDEAVSAIRRMMKTASEDDLTVFTWFLVFNRSILKTNFFKSLKTALSFRLEPSFLSADYPDRPFGVFMVVGAEMRGFHVRFSDIARGGLRLIKSGSAQAYATNIGGLFEECYSLALTQSRKNKDIPEGGSKGVILLNLAHQDKATVAFKKYVDALLDLMLTPNNEIIDRSSRSPTDPEILFFGPDENTAGYMDWAAEHARRRGYKFWKAITTGKTPMLGGIPHDEYGMTSRGVRAYELGIQRKLCLGPFASISAECAGHSGTGASGRNLLLGTGSGGVASAALLPPQFASTSIGHQPSAISQLQQSTSASASSSGQQQQAHHPHRPPGLGHLQITGPVSSSSSSGGPGSGGVSGSAYEQGMDAMQMLPLGLIPGLSPRSSAIGRAARSEAGGTAASIAAAAAAASAASGGGGSGIGSGGGGMGGRVGSGGRLTSPAGSSLAAAAGGGGDTQSPRSMFADAQLKHVCTSPAVGGVTGLGHGPGSTGSSSSSGSGSSVHHGGGSGIIVTSAGTTLLGGGAATTGAGDKDGIGSGSSIELCTMAIVSPATQHLQELMASHHEQTMKQQQQQQQHMHQLPVHQQQPASSSMTSSIVSSQPQQSSQHRLSFKPISKAMSGGPDGDLGSNEIKLSIGETIVAVIDGSGVLHDTNGLDYAELCRLANARLAASNFDRGKLSEDGFFVSVDDTDVRLPNGVVVPSGLQFRNNAHLLPFISSQFFVPCGGRPAAVTLETVDAFLYGGNADGSVFTASQAAAAASAGSGGSGGGGELGSTTSSSTVAKRRTTPRFQYVVEGANLFFTNDARLAIENRGVLLFKDASANKGGVTSSSLEVMAALVLHDDEFTAHMSCGSGTGGSGGEAGGGGGAAAITHDRPAFYRRYVEEVQATVEHNAALEFEVLWKEHTRTGTKITTLSDQLSIKITELSTRIENSEALWSNANLRAIVLRSAIPMTLSALLGGPDAVLKRLPASYQKALFGSRMASRFIYSFGLETDEFTFFEFVDGIVNHRPPALAAMQGPPLPQTVIDQLGVGYVQGSVASLTQGQMVTLPAHVATAPAAITLARGDGYDRSSDADKQQQLLQQPSLPRAHAGGSNAKSISSDHHQQQQQQLDPNQPPQVEPQHPQTCLSIARPPPQRQQRDQPQQQKQASPSPGQGRRSSPRALQARDNARDDQQFQQPGTGATIGPPSSRGQGQGRATGTGAGRTSSPRASPTGSGSAQGASGRASPRASPKAVSASVLAADVDDQQQRQQGQPNQLLHSVAPPPTDAPHHGQEAAATGSTNAAQATGGSAGSGSLYSPHAPQF